MEERNAAYLGSVHTRTATKYDVIGVVLGLKSAEPLFAGSDLRLPGGNACLGT